MVGPARSDLNNILLIPEQVLFRCRGSSLEETLWSTGKLLEDSLSSNGKLSGISRATGITSDDSVGPTDDSVGTADDIVGPTDGCAGTADDSADITGTSPTDRDEEAIVDAPSKLPAGNRHRLFRGAIDCPISAEGAIDGSRGADGFVPSFALVIDAKLFNDGLVWNWQEPSLSDVSFDSSCPQTVFSAQFSTENSIELFLKKI